MNNNYYLGLLLKYRIQKEISAKKFNYGWETIGWSTVEFPKVGRFFS